jgi:cytosine/adenosine deaminase-related metal-dependent hydrolase
MKRTLIRGADIVTMAAAGDLPKADILVEDGRIAAIGPGLGVEDAEIVEATGRIAMPGLVNAHLHTWQTALRGLGVDWTLLEYFRAMHAGLATHFLPEDIGIATLAGALNQINCGTTTLVDWCHNNPTPAHSDAAVAGLAQSGIRAVFLHGSPKPDPKPGQPHFSEVPHPRSEIERLMRGPFASRDQLLTLGAAILGPHYSTLDVALHDFRMVKELGLIASMHQGGGPAKTPDGWAVLEAEGLLGPHINITHGNDLSDAQLQRLVDLGVTFTITPENEMGQGHGQPITGRLRALGAAPSLGSDVDSVVSSEMLISARVALAHQRAADHAAARASKSGGFSEVRNLTSREALSWITTRGAEMAGLADKVGSLEIGKQADILLIDARALNLWPVNDPVAAIMQASLANIEAVMIAGNWAKRDFRLTYPGVEQVKDALQRSGARIVRDVRASLKPAG